MKTISILLSIFLALPCMAQRKHYTMSIPLIHCIKTTEDGEDEIYLLVIWKTSYGTVGSIRIPKLDDHLSMNDGNSSKSNVSFGDVLSFDLASNENIDIFCAIMEQDDGTQLQYKKVGKEILQIAKTTSRFSDIQAETFKKILARVVSTNHLSNSDDWVGAFTVFKGSSVQKTKMNNPNNSGATPDAAVINGYDTTYEFSGDGSHYTVTIRIK